MEMGAAFRVGEPEQVDEVVAESAGSVAVRSDQEQTAVALGQEVQILIVAELRVVASQLAFLPRVEELEGRGA